MHPQNPSKPFIMAAINGARRDKADHPNLPMTIEEIVAETVACQAAGADALHLHVRDSQGRHSLDPVLYAECLAAIDVALPGFPVQVTTESAGRFDVSGQLATLAALRPNAASVSVREAARDLGLAERLYALCEEAETEVQHILYDDKDAALLDQLTRTDVVKPGQNSVLFVLGKYAPVQNAKPAEFAALNPPLRAPWMVCAFGPHEQDVLIAAAQRGGAVRIGFENNIYAPDGDLAASTAANVKAFCAAWAALTPIEGDVI